MKLFKLKTKQKIKSIKENAKEEFKNEVLKIKIKEYYFSNVITRSSKTMLEFYNSKFDIKLRGTDG